MSKTFSFDNPGCCCRCYSRGCASPPLTSDGAEVVEVLGGEQRGGQLPDELLEQRCGVVRTHLVPADLTCVEVGLQVLLQQLHTEICICIYMDVYMYNM